MAYLFSKNKQNQHEDSSSKRKEEDFANLKIQQQDKMDRSMHDFKQSVIEKIELKIFFEIINIGTSYVRKKRIMELPFKE